LCEHKVRRVVFDAQTPSKTVLWCLLFSTAAQIKSKKWWLKVTNLWKIGPQHAVSGIWWLSTNICMACAQAHVTHPRPFEWIVF